MYLKIISFVLISVISLHSNWKTERENLDQFFQKGDFRFFYTLNGKNAVENQTDINKNDIPDMVENVALQFEVSHALFNHILGFKAPLEQDRYKHQKVKYIDIHFLSIKGNGNSGDAVILYDYKLIQKEKSLSIAISNKIKFENLTPAHELFHTYQNGYSMFKNRWLTEGTARWSEFTLKNRTGQQHNLPSKSQDVENLLHKTYDAKYFWNRLLFLCSKEDKGFKLPKDLKYIVYIGTNQKIIQDNTLFGYKFLIAFFENLDNIDDIVTKKRGFKVFKWKEKEQKSFKNNKYILEALKKTIIESKCKNIKEVDDFLKVLDKYIENTKNTKDLTKKVQNLGIAYKSVYKDGEDIYARNVWDMKFYNNLLYIGAGNSSNSSPSPNAGPVPIISFNPKNNIFNLESKVYDEQINLFKIINDKLYIPGHDASKKQESGNFYVKSKTTNWKSFDNIRKALHVFDIVSFKDKLFVGISTPNGAAVGISSDNGENWKLINIGSRQRTYALLKINNKLYAIKQSLSIKKKTRLSKQELDIYNIVYEYKDEKFIPRYDLKIAQLYPMSKLDRSIRISKSEVFKNKSIYIASSNYINPFSIFVGESFEKNNVRIKKIEFSYKCIPRDIIVREDKVYFLCTLKFDKIFENIVYESTYDNLIYPKELFSFKAKAFARSFEKLGSDFYFGLGCDVKNKKSWKQEELKVDTGKILYIRFIEE